MEIDKDNKLNLNELIDALHIRRKWNKLDSTTFINAYLDYYNPDDKEEVIKDIQRGLLAGLMNSDFISLSVQKF